MSDLLWLRNMDDIGFRRYIQKICMELADFGLEQAAVNILYAFHKMPVRGTNRKNPQGSYQHMMNALDLIRLAKEQLKHAKHHFK